MKSTTRTRHHRRDRRKAKQSGYAREGKTSMSGGRVGHGAGTNAGRGRTLHIPQSRKKQASPDKKAECLRFSVGDVLKQSIEEPHHQGDDDDRCAAQSTDEECAKRSDK